MTQFPTLQDVASFLEMHDKDERSSRAKWYLEITNMKIASPDYQLGSREQALDVDHALRGEINRCWLETGWAYSYGLFQSCVPLASIVVELSIERYLRRKDLWDEYANNTPEKHRTLGNLISFCRADKRRGAYLTKTILELCDLLNARRIEAAHMNAHRYLNAYPSEDLSPPNEMDETEDVSIWSVNEKGQPSIIANAAVNEPVFMGLTGGRIGFVKIRAFKRYGLQAMDLASKITNSLSQLY
jgi:hypothetical protein